MRLDASKFLEDLTGRYAVHYARAIEDMLVAKAMGNVIEFRAARIRFGEVVRDTMGTAEVLGASLVLQDAAAAVAEPGASAEFQRDSAQLLAFASEPTQVILPRVTFDDSVEAMVERTPVVIRDAAERSAQAIAKIYGRQDAIAFAKSAEEAVTKKIQDIIVQMMKEGSDEVEAGRRIVTSVEEVRKRSKAWSHSYARMAFRTNVNRAVTAGRFRTLKDQKIKKAVPAIQFLAVGDVDTRNNHNAADELIFGVDNPIWHKIAPPLGYNCRCTVRTVSRFQLQRMGRIREDGSLIEDRLPPSAHSDQGFRHGGRPDLAAAGLGGA